MPPVPIPTPPICHRCGRLLTPGKGQFHVVRIEAFADPTLSIDTDVAPDQLSAEIESLLDEMRDASEQELMDQVYRRLTLILCERCFNAWIENPTG